MPFLVKTGVVELTIGVLTGWFMVYITRTPRAERIRRGLRDPRRIRQGHIELLMMGTMLIAIGAAVPDPPLPALVLITVFSWLAPLSFFPAAVRPDLADHPAMRWTDNLTFVGLSAGYLTLAGSVLLT
ncbi:hypothetical protein [Nonomuraea africana]|uniref:Hydroxylaminobenzene mutase n=1 Tax=Nonomuraea africana TaxID=46171 RepID=A0ABR9KBE5_9ACTN|nr:hypothetical protein [Nonomuraea africana]MBE1559336.1 hydroxylaminobenzene mutase [Nonomuraea africana]